jgi:hypothetical protein
MKLTVAYNPAKDAENHMKAIFDAAYMPYGQVDLPGKLLGMVANEAIKGLLAQKGDRADTLGKITDILAESQGRPELDEKARKLEEAWVKSGDQVIFQLETLFGRDWPFKAIGVTLTTLPICPYDFKARTIFVYATSGPQSQLRILSHELNHFLFYVVYANDLSSKLGKEKFELLKESVTIFTNPESAGKPHEEPLRKLYMEKGVRGLDEAVRIGAEFLLGQK